MASGKFDRRNMFLTSEPVTVVGEMITVVLSVRNVCFFSVVYKQDSVDDVIFDNFKSGLMQEQLYGYGVVKNKGYFYSKPSLRGFILYSLVSTVIEKQS